MKVCHRTLANLQIDIANFNRTVLEPYWELEARTGTIMTARNCTFISFRLCLVPTCLYSVFFGKTVRVCLKNSTFNSSRFTAKCGVRLENAEKSRFDFHDGHPARACQRYTTTAGRDKFRRHSERFWEFSVHHKLTLEMKNAFPLLPQGVVTE